MTIPTELLGSNAGSPLRIAMVSQLFELTPPKKYGGTELFVATLTRTLVNMGHHVTLYTAGGSLPIGSTTIYATPEPLWMEGKPLISDSDAAEIHADMYRTVIRDDRYRKYDVIILNGEWHFIDTDLARDLQCVKHKCLTVMHGPTETSDRSDAWKIGACGWNLVSISDAQRIGLDEFAARSKKDLSPTWMGTVYHGLNPKDFPEPVFESTGGLVFLGRMHETKGAHTAVAIAKKAGIPLHIAARIHEGPEGDHYRAHVEPHVDGVSVICVGEADFVQKTALLRNADALLFPIEWPEPFGLVMIEAMACGCPVIGYGHGSVPEVVDEGVTGFVVSSIEEAVAAIPRARLLDRNNIRRQFRVRFSATQMATQYVRIFRTLLQGKKDAPAARLAA